MSNHRARAHALLADTFGSRCIDHEVLGWSHHPYCDALAAALQDVERETWREAERLADEMSTSISDLAGTFARMALQAERNAWARDALAAPLPVPGEPQETQTPTVAQTTATVMDSEGVAPGASASPSGGEVAGQPTRETCHHCQHPLERVSVCLNVACANGPKHPASPPPVAGPMPPEMPRHEWECVAPDGGFYRWRCKNCPATRPYPSTGGFDGTCPQTLKSPPEPATQPREGVAVPPLVGGYVCKACRGRGLTRDDTSECPTCGGTGRTGGAR